MTQDEDEIAPRIQAHINKLMQDPAFRVRLQHDVERQHRLESFGLARWQIDNARLEALRRPYVITLDEFRRVILPALRHVRMLPDDAEDIRTAELLFHLGDDEWRIASAAKDRLLSRCDTFFLMPFVRGIRDVYATLKRAERENQPWVRPLWDTRHCSICARSEESWQSGDAADAWSAQPPAIARDHYGFRRMDARHLLQQFHAGRYRFVHEVFNKHGELVSLCAGPSFLNLYERRDPTMIAPD